MLAPSATKAEATTPSCSPGAASTSPITSGAPSKKTTPLQPKGKFQNKPGGVKLKTAAKYNVRMLRQGYLYLFVESVGKSYSADWGWHGYAVHPHGYLSVQCHVP
jgi:hypothetical protein